MINFAQIDAGKKVEALSLLHSRVVAPNLIELDENGQHSGRTVNIGDKWDGAQFSESPGVAQ